MSPGEDASGSATMSSPGGCPACCAQGEAELGLVPPCFSKAWKGVCLPSPIFFPGVLSPGLCHLLEDRFPPPVSLFPPWLLAVRGGPISGAFQRFGESYTLGFGTGLPRSPVVLLIWLSQCDVSGSAVCVFGGLTYLHERFSESSAEKQLFFLGTARNH